MKKEITGVEILNPMSDALAERLMYLLGDMVLAEHGCVGKGKKVRKMTPEEQADRSAKRRGSQAQADGT